MVNWQRIGSGALAATSEIGERGRGTPTLPDDLDIARARRSSRPRSSISFEPLFGIGLAPRVIRKVAYYKPRLGTLDTPLP